MHATIFRHPTTFLDPRIIICRFLKGSERSVACYCVSLMIHLQQVSLPQLGTYLDQPFVINSSNLIRKNLVCSFRSLSISICFAFRIDFKIRTTDELDGKRIKLQINMGYCWPRTITTGILQFQKYLFSSILYVVPKASI